MDIRELKFNFDKLVKAASDQESIAVGVLAAKVKKVAESFPHDPTVVAMAGMLEKRAATSPFITRKDLKYFYTCAFSPNNKFVEHFASELGVEAPTEPTRMKHAVNEGKSFAQPADTLLTKALTSLFDPSVPYQGHTDAMAKAAQEATVYQLECLALKPKAITTVAGQTDLLICQATYETPKGYNYVYVPVEIVNTKAIAPTVFLGKEGFLDLTKKNLSEHIVATAGQKVSIDPKQLLKVIADVKTTKIEAISDVEKIVIRASASTPAPFRGALMYGSVDPAPVPVKEVPRYQAPKEAVKIAEELSKKAGTAGFIFGKNIVDQGRNLVEFSLKRLGWNGQISVAGVNEGEILYAVALDHQNGFKVPVKVIGGKVMEPMLVVGANGIAEFSKSGINELLSEGVDTHSIMQASPLYEAKPSELIGAIKEAMDCKNYKQAEEALQLLKASGDTLAFENGFRYYTDGLRGKVTTKQASTCGNQTKISGSIHVVCGHLNMPLHKVYQDSQGQCRPLYRQAMSETSEGVKLITSKIHWG